ncbi:MAG TPA: hypothetical protein VF331_18755 [Polyangiales bacterium]
MDEPSTTQEKSAIEPATPVRTPAVPTPDAAAVAPGKPDTWLARLLRRPDPLTSIAFTVPVFLVYHLGLLVVDLRAGVDLVSGALLSLLHASVPAYVIATFALTLALAGAVYVQRKRGKLPQLGIAPVLLESVAFALLLLFAFGWSTHRLARTLDDAALQSLGVGAKLVLAAGAGFHEELIFRAVLVTGAAAALVRLVGMHRTVALVVCLVGSSCLASLAYNFGAFAEPFVLQAFGYRVLAAALLALIYLTRGFAVAVYTHTFYVALSLFVYA